MNNTDKKFAPTDIGSHYDENFYATQIGGSISSASQVVPAVIQMLGPLNSVVDIGCGAGTWLNEFKNQGVKNILGLDGGNISQNQLLIDVENYYKVDLNKPFNLNNTRFDLAMSLEVAEHLPPESAEGFIRQLTLLSDVILFSAAIPGQSGTNHINERWPSYWESIFKKEGYECFDVIRPKFWYDQRVEWWYRQNTFFYVKSSLDHTKERIAKISKAYSHSIDIVHPDCFEYIILSGGGGSSAVEITSMHNYERVQSRLNEIEASASWKVMLYGQKIMRPFPRARKFLKYILRKLLSLYKSIGNGQTK